MSAGAPQASRDELVHLYDIERTAIKDELSSAYQYLSFYVGLIGAILAASLAGFLRLDRGDWRGLALLAGPMMTVVLGALGYRTVDVFYRRFAEAWVSSENIATMLAWYEQETWPLPAPPYPSGLQGGPLTRPLYPRIRKVFERAEVEHWTAERVADAFVAGKLSPTLRYARFTFASYAAIGVVLAALIVGRALESAPAPNHATVPPAQAAASL